MTPLEALFRSRPLWEEGDGRARGGGKSTTRLARGKGRADPPADAPPQVYLRTCEWDGEVCVYVCVSVSEVKAMCEGGGDGRSVWASVWNVMCGGTTDAGARQQRSSQGRRLARGPSDLSSKILL